MISVLSCFFQFVFHQLLGIDTCTLPHYKKVNEDAGDVRDCHDHCKCDPEGQRSGTRKDPHEVEHQYFGRYEGEDMGLTGYRGSR